MSIDLAALASAQRVADATPAPSYRHTNPFGPLLRESLQRGGLPFTLPAVPHADAVRVCKAIRRAAEMVGVGSSVRRTDVGGMVVITYWAKVRNRHQGKGGDRV